MPRPRPGWMKAILSGGEPPSPRRGTPRSGRETSNNYASLLQLRGIRRLQNLHHCEVRLQLGIDETVLSGVVAVVLGDVVEQRFGADLVSLADDFGVLGRPIAHADAVYLHSTERPSISCVCRGDFPLHREFPENSTI